MSINLETCCAPNKINPSLQPKTHHHSAGKWSCVSEEAQVICCPKWSSCLSRAEFILHQGEGCHPGGSECHSRVGWDWAWLTCQWKKKVPLIVNSSAPNPSRCGCIWCCTGRCRFRCSSVDVGVGVDMALGMGVVQVPAQPVACASIDQHECICELGDEGGQKGRMSARGEIRHPPLFTRSPACLHPTLAALFPSQDITSVSVMCWIPLCIR